MKLLVGYQLTESEAFLNELIRMKNSVSEVYFSYGDMPNGRHASSAHASLTEWEAARRMDEDLTVLAKEGFAFNLLLNGNCYGEKSLARGFLMSVCDLVDEVASRFGLKSITTTSPVLADLIKANFPSLEVRASVNMEISTLQGLEYIADKFDGFYIARELNRNLPQLKVIRKWCLQNNKKTYLLANSGCLSHCSARQFHDNLVAHEKQIALMENAVHFSGICGEYLSNAEDKSVYLKRLNFIRPEDLDLYDGLADGIKLATRVNRNPLQVLKAYAQKNYAGNLLELLEPDHAKHLYPYILENKKLPNDFGKVTSGCGQLCGQTECDYCNRAVKKAINKLPEFMIAESYDKCNNC